MRKLIRIISSLGRPVFWLLVSALTIIAVVLILASFHMIKINPQKWWHF